MKKIANFKEASQAMKFIDYMYDSGLKHLLYIDENNDNSFSVAVDDENEKESRKYLQIVMDWINQNKSIVDLAEKIIYPPDNDKYEP